MSGTSENYGPLPKPHRNGSEKLVHSKLFSCGLAKYSFTDVGFTKQYQVKVTSNKKLVKLFQEYISVYCYTLFQGWTKFQSFIHFPVLLYLGLFIFLTYPALYLSFIAFLSSNILPHTIFIKISIKIFFREGLIESNQFYFALFIRLFYR